MSQKWRPCGSLSLSPSSGRADQHNFEGRIIRDFTRFNIGSSDLVVSHLYYTHDTFILGEAIIKIFVLLKHSFDALN